MWNCLDFIEYETPIQNNVRKMVQRRGHIIVNNASKCHPKVLGEVI